MSFLDTAGLRESEDEIENLGISKAYDMAAAADVRVFLVEEVGEPLPIALRDGDIVRLNKGDERSSDVGKVSGKTGEGVSELLSLIAERLMVYHRTECRTEKTTVDQQLYFSVLYSHGWKNRYKK